MFCSAYQSLNDGAAQWVTMDMFYTDPDGLILEHWDTISPYIARTESGHDMVAGETRIDPSADTVANKTTVLEYTKQVLQQRDHGRVADYVAADIVQHGATIGAGLGGLLTWLTEKAGSYDMMFQLIGQGNFVATYGKRHVLGKDVAVFDLYRLAHGKMSSIG